MDAMEGGGVGRVVVVHGGGGSVGHGPEEALLCGRALSAVPRADTASTSDRPQGETAATRAPGRTQEPAVTGVWLSTPRRPCERVTKRTLCLVGCLHGDQKG